jgi:MFS superfamily sulfate permease-like transporter
VRERIADFALGFQNAAVPQINSTIIKAFASNLPATVIVIVIEHISISKSFGRVNNYIINPSQELVAIGITNIFGPFLGAYPATGSFSRTAIKSKAGVRTPFAGVITAVIVLLAIYALPAVFFYIPSATKYYLPVLASVAIRRGSLLRWRHCHYIFYHRERNIYVYQHYGGDTSVQNYQSQGSFSRQD